MKHTIPPLYERIDKGLDDSDFFQRKNFAQNLTNIFSNTEDSLTITIDAEWGEGKTTFIRLWQRDLKETETFIPVYYDAFENDFASDAFMSIAVTIQEALEKNVPNYIKKTKLDFYKEQALELGSDLAIMGASSAITFISGGIIQTKSLFTKALKFSKKFDKRDNKVLVNEKYDAFLHRKETIKEYQNALQELLKSKSTDKRKIIFFVDELDRCRPDFAIQVIEKIKHLFSVPNVNFVLAINKEQLIEIIRHAYGVNQEDAYLYLQKFVHIETRLPTLKDLRAANKENLKKYVDELFKLFEIPEELFDPDGFYQLILNSIPTIQYTPRSIERTLILYTISISSCSKANQAKLCKHVLLLCLLKIHVRPIYEDAKKNNRVLNNVNSKNVAVGANFLRFLQKGNYLSEVSGGNNSEIKISNLSEAARIVDIYDLPEVPEKKKNSFHGNVINIQKPKTTIVSKKK